jgi:hypothetical protein
MRLSMTEETEARGDTSALARAIESHDGLTGSRSSFTEPAE